MTPREMARDVLLRLIQYLEDSGETGRIQLAPSGHTHLVGALEDAITKAITVEREACAKLVDESAEDADDRAQKWENRGADDMAQAKRQAAEDLRAAATSIRGRRS